MKEIKTKMKNKLFSSASCLALCLGALALSGSPAGAQEMGSLSYYQIPEAEYRAHYHEWQVFLEYNLHREQCQHYQAPPAGYVMKGCNVYHVATDQPVAMNEIKTEIITRSTPAAPVPVAVAASPVSYTLHFGFAKWNIPDSEKAALHNAAQEIKKDNPSEVIVSGYASTPGTADYNEVLSEKRAKTVAAALEAEGVNPDIIHQRAYGETHLAVPTPDNTKMPANRRVVIEFNN